MDIDEKEKRTITMPNKLILHSDGACSGNPGPGGWGVLISYNGTTRMVSGYEPMATNNKMELLAMANGLKLAVKLAKLGHADCIEAFSDSAYLINGINNGWVLKWAKNGWKTKEDKDVKNKVEWMAILDIINRNVRITFKKVKGHNKSAYNNMVDSLAKTAVQTHSGIDSNEGG